MLRPGLVRGRPAIARHQPVEHPTGAASRPAAVASQATVAPVPPHSVVPVAVSQLASSSALGALFVVAPSSPAATPVVPPARTPSRPVVAAFQAKMVAPQPAYYRLLSNLPTLAEERRLRGENGGMDGEMDGGIVVERNGNRRTWASYAIQISNNNSNNVNINYNNNNNTTITIIIIMVTAKTCRQQGRRQRH